MLYSQTSTSGFCQDHEDNILEDALSCTLHKGLECRLVSACFLVLILLYAGLELVEHMLADIHELIQASLKRLDGWKSAPSLNAQVNFTL